MSEAFRTDLKAAFSNFCFTDTLKLNNNCFAKRSENKHAEKKNQTKNTKIKPKNEVTAIEVSF